MSTPGLTKGKQTLSHLQASSSFRLSLQHYRFSPSFPESCTIPKLLRFPAFVMLSRAFKHTPKAERNTEAKASSRSQNPQRISKGKRLPEAGTICPDTRRISKVSNKRAPGSYANSKESIRRVWRAAHSNRSHV